MSQVTPKRRDKFVASCNFCGTFLQETQGDCKCNVVCPCCGKNKRNVGMGRNNAKEYPLNFLEKGIREKNEVKYPKKLIDMGIREKNEVKYPKKLIGMGIRKKNETKYPEQLRGVGIK